MLKKKESYKVSAEELLHHIQEQGKINLDDVEEDMKKQKIIEIHKYSITESRDGRWRTYVPDPNCKNGRRQIVKSSKAKLYDELYKFYKDKDEAEQLERRTLANLYPIWLEKKRRKYLERDNNVSRINADWNKFYKDTRIVNIPIDKLDTGILTDWANDIVQTYNLTLKAYNNMSIIMRQILKDACVRKIIPYNPFIGVKPEKQYFKPAKNKTAETEIFFKEEEQKIKEHAWEQFRTNAHTKQALLPLAILFLFQTGLRIGELCALRYSDIINNGTALNVSHMYRLCTNEIIDGVKGGVPGRVITLTDEAQLIIRIAREKQESLGARTDNYIFSMDNCPINYRTLCNNVYRYCESVQIPCKSIHKIRKTVISKLLQSGMNHDAVRIFSGHKSLQTTYDNYFYDYSTDKEKIGYLNSSLSSNINYV